MSRNYKFWNPDGIYFVSFATVFWVELFLHRKYIDVIITNLNFCVGQKGMEIYAWCIMPTHIHLVFRSTIQKPEELLRDFKSFTSKQLFKLIEKNEESPLKERLIARFINSGSGNCNNKVFQIWQQNNHPIELWSHDIFQEKIKYIHNNPVKGRLVTSPAAYNFSSACDHNGKIGLVSLSKILNPNFLR